MIDYKYFDLFQKDNVDKQAIIEYSGGIMTNEELFQNSELLTESLCSEKELRFGCCEASSLKFKVANIVKPMMGETVKFSIAVGHHKDEPLVIGNYKVASDKLTADRRYRDIIAYDAMYDIINTDVADWYNSILPNKTSTVTLKQFRASFVSYFGLIQEEIDLINDGMVVEKTIEPSEISGKDVITAICEINGCFGHIGRDGKFRYILLPKYIEGLYPANDLFPADDLYPRNPNTTKISNSLHISCKYEDFVTHKIDKLQIRQTKDDIGSIVGTGTNCYIVEDNFLVYGKSASDLATIANNLFGVITEISYRPFEANVKGNPCFEVGDAVRLTTKYDIIESYILKRTLKGIQSLKDIYSADGVVKYSEKVNSVNRSIIQLKGKTNELERTVEETKSTITDVEKGLQSQITQNAKKINLEAKRASEAEGKLSGRLDITAESIAAEVTRAQGQEVELAAAIQITAESVSSKVSKGDVISEINQSAESVTIKASKINLNGAVTANDKVKINTDGSLEIYDGKMKIKSDNTDESFISLNATSPYGELGTGMGAYGIQTGLAGKTSTLMWHGLTIPGGGLLEYNMETGESDAGATNGFFSTILTNTLSANTAHIGALTTDSSSITTSDRNAKYDISLLNKEDAATFIYSLKPSRFKYRDGTSDRYHHGLIAQELKEVMVDDWGVYVDGSYRASSEQCETDIADKKNGQKGIRYEELISDLIATVQSQNERIKALEGKLDEQGI